MIKIPSIIGVRVVSFLPRDFLFTVSRVCNKRCIYVRALD